MRQPPVKTALSHLAPHVYDHVDGPIRVRAVRRGFYGHSLREVGDEFGVDSEQEIGSWMVRVTDDEQQHASAEGAEPKLEKPKAQKGGKAKTGAKSDDDVL